MKRQIQSYISEEDYSKLKLIAEKEGLLFATLIRQIVLNYLKTTANDDGLTPDEREAARDDGSTILGLSKGGLKEGLKAVKDLGLGIVSSAPRMVVCEIGHVFEYLWVDA